MHDNDPLWRLRHALAGMAIALFLSILMAAGLGRLIGDAIADSYGLRVGLYSAMLIYVVVGAVERLLSIQGADVTLPPIPLRPTALTVVSAFLDLDGNDRQGLGEAGVGGVVVNLNSANGVTAPDGRFLFNNLADGV